MGGAVAEEEGHHEDQRVYQNVGGAVAAQEGHHEDQRVYQNVGGAVPEEEDDYEDMRVYQNVGGAVPHHEDQPEEADDYEDILVNQNVGGAVPEEAGHHEDQPVYQNVGGAVAAQEGHHEDQRVYQNVGAAASNLAYAEVAGADLRDVTMHVNPAYARAGGPAENPYEPVRGLLDAAASLLGPESPPEVVEALRPIYENLRVCAAAMNPSGDAGEIDYEDISIVCENLVRAMRPLVAAGQIDEGVFENIRAYENRLDPGFAEAGDPS